MNDRLSPEIGRRDLLRILAAGAGTAAAVCVPLAAAAEDSSNPVPKKSRARYQPNSPDIQNFYRVNRYPPQR